MDVIFELQQWHGLAKLRLHSEKTLKVFEDATESLGATVRKFQRETCAYYDTRELPTEEAARGRRQAAIAAKKRAAKKQKGKEGTATAAQPAQVARGRKPKLLNLETYKWHALRDHPPAIRAHGTTDNTTTQTVGYLFYPLCFS